jgi:hypothetical protein
MTITTTQINNAISTATTNGNFNSDLIENLELRKLAIQRYINNNPQLKSDLVEKHDVTMVDIDSEIQTATPLDSSTVIIGGKTALIIEKSEDYILAKFDNPTFSDKAYFTIAYIEENKDISFFSGHYDLDLSTAINDFNKRIGK